VAASPEPLTQSPRVSRSVSPLRSGQRGRTSASVLTKSLKLSAAFSGPPARPQPGWQSAIGIRRLRGYSSPSP